MQAASILVELLKAKGLTCATAESCTGGGVGHAITAVPGSSAVYLGGVVSYDNSVKQNVLGVEPWILGTADKSVRSPGAVSSECAAQMAEGVRKLLKADIAVSITGIAGPDGGSEEKPVGTVWFGLATKDRTRTEHALFIGDRETVRQKAITHALGMLQTAA